MNDVMVHESLRDRLISILGLSSSSDFYDSMHSVEVCIIHFSSLSNYKWRNRNVVTLMRFAALSWRVSHPSSVHIHVKVLTKVMQTMSFTMLWMK
jgi:hypothetical protein